MNCSTDEDRALLESLGITDDLIDCPAGARLVRVIFGADDTDTDDDMVFWSSECVADRGFACCD